MNNNNNIKKNIRTEVSLPMLVALTKDCIFVCLFIMYCINLALCVWRQSDQLTMRPWREFGSRMPLTIESNQVPMPNTICISTAISCVRSKCDSIILPSITFTLATTNVLFVAHDESTIYNISQYCVSGTFCTAFHVTVKFLFFHLFFCFCRSSPNCYMKH